MLCYIYKSLKKEELYLYLTIKDDFSRVPEELIRHFGKLSFVMELELTPERPLARENVTKVMGDLESRGFFIQMPPTIIPLASQLPANQLH